MENKVQKSQNREALVLSYFNKDVDADDLFELLGWRNLSCQQQIQRATMVFKSLDELAPEKVCSKFEKRQAAYSLRDFENKLNVPLPCTNYYRNSLSYSCAILWNGLPL